jgi:hypothetical protein
MYGSYTLQGLARVLCHEILILCEITGDAEVVVVVVVVVVRH